jgi:hypothetical protein
VLSPARILVNAFVDLIKLQPTSDYRADLVALQCVNRAALRATAARVSISYQLRVYPCERDIPQRLTRRCGSLSLQSNLKLLQSCKMHF